MESKDFAKNRLRKGSITDPCNTFFRSYRIQSVSGIGHYFKPNISRSMNFHVFR